MTQEMDKHIRLVSRIMILLGFVYLTAVVLLCLIGLWAAKNYIPAGDTDIALLPATLMGITLLIPLALFGVMHIMTGRAFRAKAKWSRIALWILAILNFGNVPLGTAFSAYAIWILVNTRDDVRAIG